MRELKLSYCLVVIKFVLVKTSNQKSYSNKYSIPSDWTILEIEYGTRKRKFEYETRKWKLEYETRRRTFEYETRKRIFIDYEARIYKFNLNIMYTDFFKKNVVHMLAS